MENIFVFCLFVGIGSTVVLDGWVLIVEKIVITSYSIHYTKLYDGAITQINVETSDSF